jgi:hypothetical protein
MAACKRSCRAYFYFAAPHWHGFILELGGMVMAMDGVWTFLIPERQGGGVVVARNGKLYGGDIAYFLEGIYTETASAVQGTINVTLFNKLANVASVWGDKAEKFQVKFSGTMSGNSVTGKIQRIGTPTEFSLTLARRADLP